MQILAPPAKAAKRDKEGHEADAAMANDPEAQKVRDWRHKLQKAFLNSEAIPKDEVMPRMHDLFTTVENYENMTIQYLAFSKIGKVMRHIYLLSSDKVPRDEEFKFRERAKTLVDKWHDRINANNLKPNGDSTTAKPATNDTSAGKSESSTSHGKKEDKPESVSKADDHGMDVEDKHEGDDKNDANSGIIHTSSI